MEANWQHSATGWYGTYTAPGLNPSRDLEFLGLPQHYALGPTVQYYKQESLLACSRRGLKEGLVKKEILRL